MSRTRFEAWEFIIQEEFSSTGENNYIVRIPTNIKNIVGQSHLIKGPVIHWNIESQTKHVVLSKSELQSEQYVAAGITEIYDINDLNEQGGRIRPPQQIFDEWSVDPYSGQRMFYIAHQQMIESTRPTVYLLSEEQILDLLPDNRNQAGSKTDPLFNVPAFRSQN